MDFHAFVINKLPKKQFLRKKKMLNNNENNGFLAFWAF